MAADDQIIRGSCLCGEVRCDERTTFEIDPSARIVFELSIAGIALVGISSVLHALIAGGLSLLRFARDGSER